MLENLGKSIVTFVLVVWGVITSLFSCSTCYTVQGECDKLAKHCKIEAEDCQASCDENYPNRPLALAECRTECEKANEKCASDLTRCIENKVRVEERRKQRQIEHENEMRRRQELEEQRDREHREELERRKKKSNSSDTVDSGLEQSRE